MGQAQLKIAKESLDPAILEMILDALSFGIAKSIMNSAVEAVNQTDVTDSKDDGDEGCRLYQSQYRQRRTAKLP